MGVDDYPIEFSTMDQTQEHRPVPIDTTMLIIPELAKLSAVFHGASRDIYHSSKKFSMQDKSKLALL
jgi:hypothetical protein